MVSRGSCAVRESPGSGVCGSGGRGFGAWVSSAG